MNYYEARQILDGPNKGKWHFTVRNDDHIYPVGYCSRFRECPNNDCQMGQVVIDGKVVPCPNEDCENGAVRIPDEEWERHAHDTRAEAEDCYWKYTLDRARYLDPPEDPDTLHRCEVEGCDEMTAGEIDVDHRRFFACDEHRNRACAAELTSRPSQIISS